VKKKNQKGIIVPFVLVFGLIAAMILTSLLGYITIQYRKAARQEAKSNSLEAAEAGLNYYYWYVMHTLEGKTAAQVEAYWAGSPLGIPSYEGEVKSESGELISEYIIEITPPTVGSTAITATVTGWDVRHPTLKRTLKARIRKPSWSEFIVLANDVMRFGEGTEAWGPIHSNNGIRFDGLAHNLVSSEVETYWDPDTGSTKPGVWTNLPNENEVFLAGKKVGATRKDFDSVTVDLDIIKGHADSPEGLYIEPHTDPSSHCGFHVVLRPDDKVDVARIKQCGSKSYRIIREEPFTTYDMPDNGLIFVEDDVWIEGTIDTYLTVVAANLRGGLMSNMYISDDITYTDKENGTNILGLIAQNNINITLYSEDDLEIDAAMIAQNGRVGRDYYRWNQSPTYYKRDTITVFGAIATNRRYGFSWVCGSTWCSGYDTRNIIYDNTLLYTPPPFFPTGDHYEIDMWAEE